MKSFENYDPCFPDQPVVDLYLSIWANQPAFQCKPAFIWANDSKETTTWSSITYSQLNSSVEAIASHLLFPLQRGDTLLILCSPGLQLVKILFACQRAGLIAIAIVPPDPSKFSPSNQTPAHHHLLRVLAQANPKAAIADPRYISTVNRFISTSTPDRLAQLLLNLRWLSVENLDNEYRNTCCLSTKGPSEYSGCGPDEPFVLQYTSGATGIQKPVIVTAGAAAHNVREARKAYDLQPSSVIVSWLPQYHDCGLVFLLLCVVTGATCVLTSPAAFLNRPRLWLELITEFKATCTPVPSFALPLVVKRGGIRHGKLPLKLGSLQNLVLINEPIYKSLVEEFVNAFTCVGLNPSSISPSYGLAENCTFVSTAWRRSSGKSSCFPNMPSYKKLLPSAKLSISSSPDEEETEIVVVDNETCEPVEDGMEGEIWISSPSNASGYLGHPSLTREVFHGRLQGRAGRCFVKTGDRGVVIGEERYLYVVGRASDLIRVHGRRNPVHSHYLETASYNSNSMHLRGGCIVAFGVGSPLSRSRSEMVVVVAELQKRGRAGGVRIYRKICDGIREGLMKEEGVGVGLVVLVESGSVPKTTSGKLRRWAAKDKLLGGRFPVVCEIWFQESSLVHADGEEEEEIGGSEVKEGVGGEVLSFTSPGPRLSLLSFL